ncbi:YgcG family protein [Brenneria goodwinii]|nr:YgcG family protein [Brenneria goodwinii]MCG8160655.1 YgcG family protein [Brenneria goodwinii]MCG8166907.1 YgcG family protein [Brenneria goodwinii]MCG8188927.1 YgcG family protein [Brenneria goodwinii]MCG8193456.1 YgcG family protein [Brenneria goodwinii]
MYALLLCCLTLCVARAETVAVPVLHQRVTDLTQTLNESQQQQLESELRQLEQTTRTQLAVLILPTTGDDSIEQFAIRVFDQWKLGDKTRDDGVLLLVALQDRTMRIEVGYGLEGKITDVQAGRIIRDTMTPLFRQNDYFGGIQQGVQSLGALINGEPLPAASESPADDYYPAYSDGGFKLWCIGMIMLPLWVFRRSNYFLRALKSAVTLTVGGILFSLLFGRGIHNAYDVFSFIIMLIASFVLLLIGQPLLSLIALKGGGGGPGGGGFSGGGGSSGGGGASGRW